MSRSPLSESLQLLSKYSDRGVAFFYAVLFAIFLLLVGISYSPCLQRMAMRKFHFVPRPFAQWAFCQFFPSMYNFHNEIWMSREPITPLMLEGKTALPNGTFYGWVNHYPLRLISFSLQRKNFSAGTYYVYLRSTYRGQNFDSQFILKGKPGELFLERLP